MPLVVTQYVQLLLVAGLGMTTMFAVGLLPLLAICDGSESGATAPDGAIAVCTLRGNVVMSVDFDCRRSFGSRCRSKRAETYESGSRAGNDCESKNELLHFQIP